MPKWTDKLKQVLAVVAPTLALALPGPLGGIANSIIAKALGKEDASEDEIAAIVSNATPEQIIAIKRADQEFEKFLKEQDIKLLALDVEDRADARAREIALPNWTPSILAGAVTCGFFGVLLWILKYGLPKEGADALLIMLGSLGTAWTGIVAYYFGSSSGSARKDATIAAVTTK